MAAVSNVTSGKPDILGAVYVAPIGTDLPTSTTEALDDAFESLGYLSEDGLVNSNSPESDAIKAWGGDTVLVVNSTKDDTFALTLIEALNEKVLKVVYGAGNVSGTLSAGISVNANSSDADELSWVFDMIMRDGVKKRIVVPFAKLTKIGDVSYTDSDAVGYEITIQALPDEAGNTHYEYIK